MHSPERRSGVQWQFPGDVRFHGLRLLCLLDRTHFFSERECFCIADAGADDVRGRVFDATNRSRHSRRLY